MHFLSQLLLLYPSLLAPPYTAGTIPNDNNFNPRTSCEVRLLIGENHVWNIWFQSTHLVWGATNALIVVLYMSHISIHAPRVRCDLSDIFLWALPDISIHAPRVRCDRNLCSFSIARYNFNPRTSCEVRQKSEDVVQLQSHFNPRTSCEVRRYCPNAVKTSIKFQSTHLVWGATVLIIR